LRRSLKQSDVFVGFRQTNGASNYQRELEDIQRKIANLNNAYVSIKDVRTFCPSMYSVYPKKILDTPRIPFHLLSSYCVYGPFAMGLNYIDRFARALNSLVEEKKGHKIFPFALVHCHEPLEKKKSVVSVVQAQIFVWSFFLDYFLVSEEKDK